MNVRNDDVVTEKNAKTLL